MQEIQVVVNQLETNDKERNKALFEALAVIDRASKRAAIITIALTLTLIIFFVTLTMTAIFTD